MVIRRRKPMGFTLSPGGSGEALRRFRDVVEQAWPWPIPFEHSRSLPPLLVWPQSHLRIHAVFVNNR